MAPVHGDEYAAAAQRPVRRIPCSNCPVSAATATDTAPATTAAVTAPATAATTVSVPVDIDDAAAHRTPASPSSLRRTQSARVTPLVINQETALAMIAYSPVNTDLYHFTERTCFTEIHAIRRLIHHSTVRSTEKHHQYLRHRLAVRALNSKHLQKIRELQRIREGGAMTAPMTEHYRRCQDMWLNGEHRADTPLPPCSRQTLRRTRSWYVRRRIGSMDDGNDSETGDDGADDVPPVTEAERQALRDQRAKEAASGRPPSRYASMGDFFHQNELARRKLQRETPCAVRQPPPERQRRKEVLRVMRLRVRAPLLPSPLAMEYAQTVVLSDDSSDEDEDKARPPPVAENSTDPIDAPTADKVAEQVPEIAPPAPAEQPPPVAVDLPTVESTEVRDEMTAILETMIITKLSNRKPETEEDLQVRACPIPSYITGAVVHNESAAACNRLLDNAYAGREERIAAVWNMMATERRIKQELTRLANAEMFHADDELHEIVYRKHMLRKSTACAMAELQQEQAAEQPHDDVDDVAEKPPMATDVDVVVKPIATVEERIISVTTLPLVRRRDRKSRQSIMDSPPWSVVQRTSSTVELPVSEAVELADVFVIHDDNCNEVKPTPTIRYDSMYGNDAYATKGLPPRPRKLSHFGRIRRACGRLLCAMRKPRPRVDDMEQTMY